MLYVYSMRVDAIRAKNEMVVAGGAWQRQHCVTSVACVEIKTFINFSILKEEKHDDNGNIRPANTI